MKKYIPWQIKLILKIILSKLAINRRLLHRLGIFRHGGMDTVDYSQAIFNRHFQHFKPIDEGFTVLELGPGNGITNGLYAHALGAAKTFLVDHGDHATRDMSFYHRIVESLPIRKTRSTMLRHVQSFEELLDAAQIICLAEGLKSLRSIESESVDFVFSNAVLEHVWLDEFQATMEELYRILKPGGLCSHEVDIKDHLGASLNNLRFSKKIWESRTFRESGFYTNRIRYEEMLQRFREAGFKVRVIQTWKWDKLPLKRSCLSRSFNHLSDEDLCVYCFDVLLTKA